MYEDDAERERKNAGPGLTWWVRYAVVPVAVALIAGLSAVRAAELLQPVPEVAPPAAPAIPTQPTGVLPPGGGVQTEPVTPIATDPPLETPVAQQTESPPPTDAPTLTATPAPQEAVLGRHVVRRGEYLYCIGRGYGVPPQAIAQANHLGNPAQLRQGQVLAIPNISWKSVPYGPVCATQFDSPYAGRVAHRPRIAPPEVVNTGPAIQTPQPGVAVPQTEEPAQTVPPGVPPTEYIIDTAPPYQTPNQAASSYPSP